jgi:hypothetical protein
MSQVYNLGAYRAIAKGVQEFFLSCLQDMYYNVDLSCKQDDIQGVNATLLLPEKEHAMPPPGWKSGRPEGIVKAVRLTQDIIDRITRYVARLQAELPDDRINEGIALRRLIRIGLDTVESRPAQPQPAHVSLETQPALPLALEGVPASQAQSVTPAPQLTRRRTSTDASPALVQCTVNANHRRYKASLQECPMCANNRRTREFKQRAKEREQTPA